MLESFKEAILSRFPQLNTASFSLLTNGWDSLAVDVDDQLIFKFPRDEDSVEALHREAALLGVIRPRLTLPVPDLIFYTTPQPFSKHTKLRGEALTTTQYERLTDSAKQKLVETIACFYAELHAINPELLQTAGALPIDTWPAPDEILSGIQSQLPKTLFHKAEKVLSEWAALPNDPYGTIYGFSTDTGGIWRLIRPIKC